MEKNLNSDSAELNVANQESFLKNGFVVAEKVFSQSILDSLSPFVQNLIRSQTEAELSNNLSLGSLIKLWSEPYFVNLISAPELLDFLKKLGALDIRFSNGYLFSKPASSPPTFWHQDWWLWNEPVSFENYPAQIGALIYLEKTTAQNGCLRVIPGSHKRQHALHASQSKYDIKDLRRHADPKAEQFSNFSDEVDVPVNPGDVVFFDSRLLHAAHANSSQTTRNALTFWYYPNYMKLSESIRARIGTVQAPANWPESYIKKLSEFLPAYCGQHIPAEIFCEGSPTR